MLTHCGGIGCGHQPCICDGAATQLTFEWKDGGRGVSAFTHYGPDWWAAFWPADARFRLWIIGPGLYRWGGMAATEIEALAALETRLRAELAYQDDLAPSARATPATSFIRALPSTAP